MNRHFVRIWIPLYLVVLVATVAGMYSARRQALAVYGTEKAQVDWEEWVAEAKRQEAGSGPVRRRAPQSTRPPAAVLMEEHFATCLSGALVLGSALFWSFAFLVHGAFAQPAVTPRGDDQA